MTDSSFPAGLTLSNISLDVADGRETRHLLRSVSLHVAPGEVVGLTGPSGSGKSTLLAIAGCLQEPTSGKVVLSWDDPQRDDVVVSDASGADAASVRREHIGMVFQQPNLLPALTVSDQLLAMTRLGKILPARRAEREAHRERAEELLEAVGLSGLGSRRVGELSGGQQARVNVARALMNNPDVLLVDEPTAALDRENAFRITQLIQRLAQDRSLPTVYVSHDREQLGTLDRLIYLVDGEITDAPDALAAPAAQDAHQAPDLVPTR